MQKSLRKRLRKSNNGPSNHRFSIKTYDISKYDIFFSNYPTTPLYLQHRKNLTNGVRISLADDHPLRPSNNTPSFSISEKWAWPNNYKNG